jgi:urea transporter
MELPRILCLVFKRRKKESFSVKHLVWLVNCKLVEYTMPMVLERWFLILHVSGASWDGRNLGRGIGPAAKNKEEACASAAS